MSTSFFIDLLLAELVIGLNLGLYLVFLRKRSNFRLNRLILILPLIAAAVLPFLPKIAVSDPALIRIVLPEISTGSAVSVKGSDAPASIDWTLLYAGVSCLFFIRLLWMSFSSVRMILRAQPDGSGYRRGPYSAFTFLFWTVLPSEKDVPEAIHIHESVHRRELHSLDILIMELFLALHWFSPFARVYRRMLVENHEFTADAVAINTADRTQYTDLLLAEASLPTPVLAHSFLEQSLLKNRLRMMYQNPSRKGSWLYALILPVVCMSLFMACSKAVESPELPVDRSAATETPLSQAETMPEYPGGFEALSQDLGNAIVYPESAKAEGIEGTVMVKFVVAKDGSVGNISVAKSVNEALDAAAVEAVGKLKRFVPGENEGETVAVEMVLPVAFRLS